MATKSLGVALACYNRKTTTLRSLKQLFDTIADSDLDVHVYLLDDASPDGTGNAVREAFPSVNVIDGTGSMYWNGGMRVAFQAAINERHDFYLWLNDDVELERDAIEKLFATYKAITKNHGPDNIIIGAMSDPTTGETSYGGINHSSRIWTMSFEKVTPYSDKHRICETMNGNLVLIPSSVVDNLGNIAPNYTHSYGDMDYGIRAGKAGIRIFICPNHLGKCELNQRKGAFHDPDLSIAERWKIVNSPFGMPFRETIHFCYTYRGVWGVLLGMPAYRYLFGMR